MSIFKNSMSEQSYIRNEAKEIVLYLFLIVITALILPILAGLILKGFEESFVEGQALTFGSYLANFMIYTPMLIVALLVVLFPLARILSLKRSEHPATAPNPSWFRIFTVSYIYNPEENGLLWYLSEELGFKEKRNFMRWSLNPLRVIIIAILIFGLYGIFLVSIPQLSISSVPQLQLQQVTVASEVTFSSFVPSGAENGVLLFIFMLLMGLNAWVVSSFKLGKTAFFSIGFFVCILMGLTWLSLHGLIYGNDESKLIGTFIFGFVGSLITWLTGILIFWWIWHISNNAFIKIQELILIKEDILFVSIIIWFVILIGWISIELAIRKKKAREFSIQGN